VNYHHLAKPCPICGTREAAHERTLNGIELVRCETCDFVYANLDDREIQAANSSFGQDATAIYEEYQTFIDVVWFEHIAEKLTGLAGVGTVLDIGCGNGTLLRHFIERGWTAHGLDPSPWAAEFAQKYGYRLHSCTLEDAGLPESHFDVVTSTSTLEHIPQPCQHVREMIRVLKPGGIAYIAGVPNYGSLAIRLNVSKFDVNTPPEHANYFTEKSMRRLFAIRGVAEHVASLSVTSYGVPELYRIYPVVLKLARRILGTLEKSRGELTTSRSEGGSRRAFMRISKRAMAIAVIATYVYPGRPFHFGDKLAVMALKDFPS